MSERIGCEPWVLDDDERITPYEWRNRVLAVMNAEAEAAEWRRKDNERKARNRPKGRR